jgi:hypothetical protein
VAAVLGVGEYGEVRGVERVEAVEFGLAGPEAVEDVHAETRMAAKTSASAGDLSGFHILRCPRRLPQIFMALTAEWLRPHHMTIAVIESGATVSLTE